MFTTTLLPAVLVPVRSRLTFAAIWTQFATRMVITIVTLHTIWTLRNLAGYQTREHDLTNQVAARASSAWPGCSISDTRAVFIRPSAEPLVRTHGQETTLLQQAYRGSCPHARR